MSLSFPPSPEPQAPSPLPSPRPQARSPLRFLLDVSELATRPPTDEDLAGQFNRIWTYTLLVGIVGVMLISGFYGGPRDESLKALYTEPCQAACVAADFDEGRARTYDGDYVTCACTRMRTGTATVPRSCP